MDPYVQALLMGLVQGLTEFLPISSSGHLVVLPDLLGWEDPLLASLAFSVFLHMGTLLALILYFIRDWLAVLRSLGRLVRTRRVGTDPDRRLARNLILATIPAGAAGYALNDLAETTFRDPALVAGLLLAGGGVMLLADRFGRKNLGVDAIRAREAFIIGCGQALALLPGVSRSGISISFGMFIGLDRAAAARFSFLMATPIIAGAGVFEIRRLLAPDGLGGTDGGVLAVGFVAALLSGLLAIRFMLRFLRTHSLAVFVAYRAVLAVAILAVLATR
ncbi:MAG: undecaprenyl-diphosphatase [Chloroflexota bacterium]